MLRWPGPENRECGVAERVESRYRASRHSPSLYINVSGSFLGNFVLPIRLQYFFAYSFQAPAAIGNKEYKRERRTL